MRAREVLRELNLDEVGALAGSLLRLARREPVAEKGRKAEFLGIQHQQSHGSLQDRKNQ